MAIQITIIGLGQVGASIGLALMERKDLFLRIGHDKNPDIARKAQKMAVIDKMMINLPSAVREADIVILSLPMDQIQDTLGIIAQDLKENVVVMDTGPVKEVVAAWAGELLPDKRYYVGLTPVINPAYLMTTELGLEAARADLFHKGLMAIVAPPRTASDAIKLAADLTRLLGAQALFADPVEVDSLMAATHITPHLLAAALLNATVDHPGWREARKLAGRPYAEVTGPAALLNKPQTLAKSVLLNRENSLRSIDGVMAALQALRNDIEESNTQALEERLKRAHLGWEQWWKDRHTANWAAEEMPDSMANAPTGSEVFGRLLGFGRKRNNKP
jgi:prephenate dehydrogenase